MESMGMVFEMKSEAKVAFKTAALYFLIMVLSIVYSHNHVLIHANCHKWNVWGRMRDVNMAHLRRYFALVVRRYRRRQYSHVQEVNGMIGSGGGGVPGGNGNVPGIGLAKVDINAMNMNMNTHSHSSQKQPANIAISMGDYDSDSGLEEVGLSMREGSRRTKDHEEQGFASFAWTAIMDKAKKR